MSKEKDFREHLNTMRSHVERLSEDLNMVERALKKEFDYNGLEDAAFLVSTVHNGIDDLNEGFFEWKKMSRDLIDFTPMCDSNVNDTRSALLENTREHIAEIRAEFSVFEKGLVNYRKEARQGNFKEAREEADKFFLINRALCLYASMLSNEANELHHLQDKD